MQSSDHLQQRSMQRTSRGVLMLTPLNERLFRNLGQRAAVHNRLLASVAPSTANAGTAPHGVDIQLPHNLQKDIAEEHVAACGVTPHLSRDRPTLTTRAGLPLGRLPRGTGHWAPQPGVARGPKVPLPASHPHQTPLIPREMTRDSYQLCPASLSDRLGLGLLSRSGRHWGRLGSP